MRIVYPSVIVKEPAAHIAEKEDIYKLLEAGKSFVLCAGEGAGKTWIIDNYIIPRLDQMSQENFRNDDLKNYAKFPCNTLDKTELENFYLSFFCGMYGYPTEDFSQHLVDDILDRIILSFRQLRQKYNCNFFIIVDDFEHTPDWVIYRIGKLHKSGICIILATPERKISRKYRYLIQDIEVIVVRPIGDMNLYKEFYDYYLHLFKVQLTPKAYLFLWNKINIMYNYPGALYRVIESLSYQIKGRVGTVRDIDKVRVHKWGLKYRDLTLVLFSIIFLFFFARFLFMRGPESWRYMIYASMAITSTWIYRIFAKRMMLTDEDMLVEISEQDPPKWYQPYASYGSILLHIACYFLVISVMLILTDNAISAPMLLPVFLTFIPDIDIRHSKPSQLFKKVLRIIHKDWWVDLVEGIFAHRGAIHSFWTPAIIGVITLPIMFTEKIMGMSGTILWICIVLAPFSHLIADALSPMGVPIFFPLKHRWVTPHATGKQIPTGSVREGTVAVFMTLIFLALLPFIIKRPSTIYEVISRDPILAKGKIISDITREQYVDVEGYNILSNAYIKQKYKIVGTDGIELFLEDEDGNVLHTKDDINVYKMDRHPPGAHIRFSAARRTIRQLTSFDEFVASLPEGYYTGSIKIWSAQDIGGLFTLLPSAIRGERSPKVMFDTDGYIMYIRYANKQLLKKFLKQQIFIISADIMINMIKK